MKKVIILENFLLKMNKFNEIVKEFSDPDTPGNEKRIKKINMQAENQSV